MSHSRSPSSSKQSSRRSSTSASQDSKSSSEVILDLGQTESVAVAQQNVEKWITSQFKGITGEWKPLWGTKLTEGKKNDSNTNEGLRNLGRVIGQEYFVVGLRYTSGEKTLASFRVDWDPEKGKHFNPSILNTETRKKYAYKFGNKDADSTVDPETKKTFGETHIINQMLLLTKDALERKQLMSPEQAQLILSNFEIQSKINRSYFKDFSALLRPLIESAQSVIASSNEHKNEDAYKFDSVKLASQATSDLHDIWSPEVELYLDQISHIKAIPDEPLNPIASQVLVSELIYAIENKTHGEATANSISNFFSNKDNNVTKLFMSYLCSTVDDENKLNKLQSAIQMIDANLKPSSHLTANEPSDTSKKEAKSSADIFKSLMKSNSAAKEAAYQSLQTPSPTLSSSSKKDTVTTNTDLKAEKPVEEEQLSLTPRKR
jgi:hypothetical protein